MFILWVNFFLNQCEIIIISLLISFNLKAFFVRFCNNNPRWNPSSVCLEYHFFPCSQILLSISNVEVCSLEAIKLDFMGFFFVVAV